MTCADFQKVLPYIIESGGNLEEEEHLRTCQVCSDLVADLKYIADQAKLLVPMEDPSPKVWDGIRGTLEREELFRPARGERRRLLRNKGLIPWVVTLAVLLLASTWHFMHKSGGEAALSRVVPAVTSIAGAVPSGMTESDDLMLLSAVESANPSVSAVYAETLRQVNAAISEATESLRRTPQDHEIRQFLMEAYRQKAMLYSMALQSLS